MKHKTSNFVTKKEYPNLTESQILNYLNENPRFFVNNIDLLDQIEVPKRWNDDNVADLQSFLLDRRSNEIDELRDCAQEVIETSRSNLSVQTRTHAAILSLISANDINGFIQALTHDVPFYLDLDSICLGFEPPAMQPSNFAIDGIRSFEKGTATHFIGVEQNICIYPSINRGEIIFGPTAKPIVSCVLARINPSEQSPIGVLGLGSYNEIFHLDQGTELINFLARVIEILIKKHLI